MGSSTNGCAEECVLIGECVKGDRIRVDPFTHKGKEIFLFRIVILKIKPIPKTGLVQIKYKSDLRSSARVQKIDIPENIFVTRITEENSRHCHATLDSSCEENAMIPDRSSMAALSDVDDGLVSAMVKQILSDVGVSLKPIR